MCVRNEGTAATFIVTRIIPLILANKLYFAADAFYR